MEAPLFQFEFDGALLTLKQKTPSLAPLLTLPPRISDSDKKSTYSLFLSFVTQEHCYIYLYFIKSKTEFCILDLFLKALKNDSSK